MERDAAAGTFLRGKKGASAGRAREPAEELHDLGESERDSGRHVSVSSVCRQSRHVVTSGRARWRASAMAPPQASQRTALTRPHAIGAQAADLTARGAIQR